MIKRIFLWIVALSALFMVPYSFYMSTMFQQVFYKVFPLEIDKGFTGGELEGQYSDPFQDDKGWGGMLYPQHASFMKGSVDILEYRVHKPQRNGSWSEIPHYWQLAISTSSISPERREPAFRIYLDIKEGGLTHPLKPDEEKVLLDPLHPWDYRVDVIPAEKKALLLDNKGTELDEMPLYINHSTQSYIFRIPLRYGVEAVLDGRDSYHQLISGFYDPVSFFAPVKMRSSLRSPGGAIGLHTPSVADYLAPEGIDQFALLGSEDTPVLKALHHQPGRAILPAEEKIQENRMTEAEAKAEEQRQLSLLEEELARDDISTFHRAEILFWLGRYTESRSIFESIWEEEQEPLALVHLATITSIDASTTGAMEAVELVNLSYRLFDEAWELCAEDPYLRMNLLMHRGNTSNSVPQEVFGKAESAGDDFTEAAEIMEKLGDDPPEAIASLYRKASEAYAKASLQQKSRVARLKAESFENLSMEAQ